MFNETLPFELDQRMLFYCCARLTIRRKNICSLQMKTKSFLFMKQSDVEVNSLFGIINQYFRLSNHRKSDK